VPDPLDPVPSSFARLVYLEEAAQLLVVPKHFLDADGLLPSLCPSLTSRQVQYLLAHTTATKSSPYAYQGPLGTTPKLEQLLVPI
jgi:hypothetical protein